MSDARLVWRAPLDGLAVELRADAQRFVTLPGGADLSEVYAGIAVRLEARIADAAASEWLLTEDAATLLEISPDALRARCRRRWREEGRAEKRGGQWWVRVTALTAAA